MCSAFCPLHRPTCWNRCSKARRMKRSTNQATGSDPAAAPDVAAPLMNTVVLEPFASIWTVVSHSIVVCVSLLFTRWPCDRWRKKKGSAQLYNLHQPTYGAGGSTSRHFSFNDSLVTFDLLLLVRIRKYHLGHLLLVRA